MRAFFVVRGGAITLAVLVLYLALAPHHVVDGDNAHFAALGAVGGVAHPSGYPLYVLWLRAFSWLPGATPAHTTALATAILAAIQIFVLHAACRAWGARSLAATVAVGLYAVGPVAMRQHTEAEVFALNGLVVAGVLWLAAREGPLRGTWRAGMLGLVAGLGMANHFTCALVAPVGLVGVVRGVREARTPIATGLATIGGFAVGLLPYLYVFTARTGMPSWGNITTLHDLRDLVMREDYGGLFSFAPNGQDVTAGANLIGFARTVGRIWWWLPALAGLAMLGVRCVRGNVESVASWRFLAISWFVAGPLLALRFNLPPVGVGRYVVERFCIMPAMLLAIPVALAFDQLGTWGANARFVRFRGVLAVAVLVAAAASSLDDVQRMHSPALELEIENSLGSLPKDAVVIGTSDDLLFGFTYAQVVLHQRADLVYMSWSAMAVPWYRADLARDGFTVDVSVPGERIVGVAKQILARHRRVFVDPELRELVDALPHTAFGIYAEILPPGTAPPLLEREVEINKALYESFDLDYPRPRDGDEWPAVIQLRYARTWARIGNELENAKRTDEAHWAYGVANALAPEIE